MILFVSSKGLMERCVSWILFVLVEFVSMVNVVPSSFVLRLLFSSASSSMFMCFLILVVVWGLLVKLGVSIVRWWW